jgi:hypothetical protein
VKFHAMALAAMILAAPRQIMSQAVQRQSAAKVVHHFTDKSTVIEQGDTVTWIHSTTADSTRKAAEHTFVYLVRPDIVILLKPNGPRPLQPFYAKTIRDLLKYAREQDALEQKLGHSTH